MNNKTEYKVNTFVVGQTKNGKEMWRIGLTSMADEKPLTGVIWSEDIPRFDGTRFKVGNIIKFLGQDYNSNYNSVVIKNVTVVKEAISGVPKAFEDKYMKEITEYLESVVKKYENSEEELKFPLRVFARELSKEMMDKRFRYTPAAVYHHHNYLGGLLRHTYEVWQMAKGLCRTYLIENSDAFELAALGHDIGKMYEYTTNIELGTCEVDKEWLRTNISHLVYGYNLAYNCGAFDIARMIGCHHEKLEWGAMFEPETPEEKALHQIDMLSAAIGMNSIDKLEALVDKTIAEEKAARAVKEAEKEIKEEKNVHPHSDDVL